MSYNINENYGKRAYIELEDLKSSYTNSLEKKNNTMSIKSSKYNIYSNDDKINKHITFVGCNKIGFVKITNNNDTNNTNIKIIIKNKNNIIYCKNLCNDVCVMRFFDTNNIDICIENDAELLIDIDIEFCSEGLADNQSFGLVCDETIMYVAKAGCGETYLYSYSDVSKINTRNFDSVVTLPIEYMDIKNLQDISNTIVIIGRSATGMLVAYKSSDNFAEAVEIASEFDTAKIHCNGSGYKVYFTHSSKLYVACLVEESTWLTHQCIVEGLSDCIDVYTPNFVNSSSLANNLLLLKNKKGNIYLVYHSVTILNGEFVGESSIIRYLSSADRGSMSFYNDEKYVYISYNGYTKKYLVEFEIESGRFVTTLVQEIAPCDDAIYTLLGEAKICNNYITI